MWFKCLFVTLFGILSQSVDSGDIPYSRCLETQTYCQSLPESCLRENGLCNTLLIASAASGQSVEFQMYGKSDNSRHYFAMALSEDRLMGNDSVTEIYVTSDGTHQALRQSWNQRRGNTALDDNQLKGIKPEGNVLNDNGIVSAKWMRNVISEVTVDGATHEFDLKTNKYIVMLANGPVSGDNKIKHHSEKSVSASGVDLLFGNEDALKDLYSKCNKSEVSYCFGLPNGCVGSQNCQILLAITNTGYGLTDGTVSFQLIGKTEDSSSGWIGVGLSEDNRMGNDSVVECIAMKNGKNVLTNSWNKGHTNEPVGDIKGIVATGPVVNENGLINCKWTRLAQTQVEAEEFDLKAKQYYILLAKGPVKDNGEKTFHSLFGPSSAAINLTSSVEPSPPTSATNSSVMDEAYQRCHNDERLCFGYKKGVTNCVQQKNCLILFSSEPISKSEGTVEIELLWEKGSDTSDNWVAVGLSDDQSMGKDHVTECVLQNGSPSVRTAINPNGHNPTENVVDKSVTPLASSFKDNLVHCKWNRTSVSNVTLKDTNYYYDIQNNEYYLLLAFGPLSGDNIGYHSDKTWSSTKVNLQSVGTLTTGVNLYVQVHAALMTIAWLGCVSIAILLARHYKNSWPDSTLCGVKLWFAFHRLLMVFGVTLILISFVLILVNKKGWVGVSAHPVVGLISIILSFLQPIGALFRPGPDGRFRWLFNLCHWSGGYIGHALAVVAILLSTTFTNLLPDNFFWILISLIIFYLFSHISLHHLRTIEEKNGNDLKINSSNGLKDSMVLALICLVITALVVALVVLIYI